MKRIILLLICLLCLFWIPKSAHAQCVGTMEVTFPCNNGSCSSQYTKTFCSYGCQSGTCVGDGGSGLCCDIPYYSATIYPGEGCFNCGEARRVHISRSSAPTDRHVAELRRGAVLSWIELSSALSYRPPSLIFVPDRCRRTYGVIVKEGAVFADGGM